MVARSPPKPRKKMVAPLDPNQLRETLNKVEKCLNRLQELEYVTGGRKVKSGLNLSPRGSRGYLRTIRNGNNQKSPPGKLPTQIGEWKKMSLPAMILGETMGEILQATRFAREIVSATTPTADPKTPVTASRQKSRLNPESTNLRARRKREKQIIRPEPHSPLLQRTKSRINFKVSGSPPKPEPEKENRRLSFSANRVSPKNRPWARKTVIFPNPMFHSSSNTHNQKISRPESPVIPKTRPVTPHKFLIKTPPGKAAKRAEKPSSTASVVKFQVKIRSPTISVSPTRASSKKKVVSPPKKVSTAAKLRRSFSPSRLASKLVSPLKNRRLSVQGCVDGTDGMNMMNMNMNMMSGLKQRPMSTGRRI